MGRIAILVCPIASTKKNEAVLLHSNSNFQKNEISSQLPYQIFTHELRKGNLILTSSTIDKKLENFEFIFEFKALATFTAYARYPALDCLSQNFVKCGQAIK